MQFFVAWKYLTMSHVYLTNQNTPSLNWLPMLFFWFVKLISKNRKITYYKPTLRQMPKRKELFCISVIFLETVDIIIR